ncbi:hypothetical protein C900_00247 [Fulvivirga imtechensis AK7]|uniref:Uncharacterized protein n=1 Tax=Fulvivirga imtechensis AK7 TaxID=1237149 RepID=L8JM00_9BACT|nr:hypothetical protein C900_00247 [Fulvivirga imtechensis AK7]
MEILYYTNDHRLIQSFSLIAQQPLANGIFPAHPCYKRLVYNQGVDRIALLRQEITSGYKLQAECFRKITIYSQDIALITFAIIAPAGIGIYRQAKANSRSIFYKRIIGNGLTVHLAFLIIEISN